MHFATACLFCSIWLLQAFSQFPFQRIVASCLSGGFVATMFAGSVDLKTGNVFRYIILQEVDTIHPRHGGNEAEFLALVHDLRSRYRLLDWLGSRSNDSYNSLREMTLIADTL